MSINLGDLKEASICDMGFIPTVNTKYLGILGFPLSKSLSPRLHNVCFRKLGLDYLYLPLEVKDEEALRRIVENMGYYNFVGFNVTVPWKEKVIQFLDELDESASLCGAVNTIAVIDGKRVGYNTDGKGFMMSFREAFGEGVAGKKVLILGAGGSARSISVEMLLNGADLLLIVNRSIEKGEKLVKDLEKLFPGRAKFLPLSDLKMGKGKEFDVVVNTTSVGMYASDRDSLLSKEDFKMGQLVCDIVYDPPVTKMLEYAEKAGAKTLSGRGMLIYQAALAFKIWIGVYPDTQLMFRVFDSHFENLERN
ncbi:MAG: shikimate dehydrogenase [Synergistetes bacterium]|nr:shikimate dehydrogenase [Synergistota bacterium]